MLRIGGNTVVAGVVGRPIGHSLSPLLHNAWLEASRLDGVYAPFSPPPPRFRAFIDGLRGGVVRGLNVTMPFKEEAMAAADDISAGAASAGAANLLIFHTDGRIEGRNTDGEGLLYAFKRQAPGMDWRGRSVAILGAGGAARGAVAVLQGAGVADIRVVNRSVSKAQILAAGFLHVTAWALENAGEALDGADVVINATSAEVGGSGELDLDLSRTKPGAVAMDMLYKPLTTRFLAKAALAGLQGVDGLDMLIGQAIPSFEALFGAPAPADVDARALLLAALDQS